MMWLSRVGNCSPPTPLYLLRLAFWTSFDNGMPMLPVTQMCRNFRLRLRISAVRRVVVDFPFVPVMATIGAGQTLAAISSSPTIGMPKDRAVFSAGIFSGTPGETAISPCLRCTASRVLQERRRYLDPSTHRFRLEFIRGFWIRHLHVSAEVIKQFLQRQRRCDEYQIQ